MSFIELQDVYFRYTKDDYALNGINLSINRGEHVCILGHNGSGKSTLAKILVGLIEKKKGHIYIDGIELDEKTIDNIRQKIGIVFQNPDNQFVGVTVEDDIAFGLENRKVSRDEMIKLINQFSSKVSMQDFLNRNPEELSGGEKQRVAIAGVLAMNPEVIIFDEATSMLDPKGVKEVMEVIENIKKEKTIISITHNLSEAKHCDRIIVMNQGKIVLDGTPEEVFKNTNVLIESRLDILDSMKLIEKVKNSTLDMNKKQKVEDALWQYAYHK